MKEKIFLFKKILSNFSILFSPNRSDFIHYCKLSIQLPKQISLAKDEQVIQETLYDMQYLCEKGFISVKKLFKTIDQIGPKEFLHIFFSTMIRKFHGRLSPEEKHLLQKLGEKLDVKFKSIQSLLHNVT